jgi:hypothetical protein
MSLLLLEERTVEVDELYRLEAHLQSRLNGRIHDLRLAARAGGLVIEGHARTYYAKQLAQHALMEATGLPILANEILVY